MSPARTLTTWLWSAVSALLLFVVAAHAVAPVTAEYARGRGSAFSASTEEVAIKAATRADIAKELVRLDPVVPPRFVPLASLAPAVLADAPNFLALPVTRTTADPALQPLSPRAPPFA